MGPVVQDEGISAKEVDNRIRICTPYPRPLKQCALELEPKPLNGFGSRTKTVQEPKPCPTTAVLTLSHSVMIYDQNNYYQEVILLCVHSTPSSTEFIDPAAPTQVSNI